MTTDMQEAVERTIQTIERQLELIADRAPGDYLDKRPVVQSLRQHKKRLEAALASRPDAQVDERGAFQSRVHPWMLECFGSEIAADKIERNHRFFEEAGELVQACGMTSSEAHQLVDYTWGRPVGEKSQEVGGVMVTLAALCLANGLDMHAAGEVELARISAPEMMAKIRAKQAAKPKHSPLPEARAAAPQAARDQHEKSDLYKEGYLAGKAAASAPSPDREQVGEAYPSPAVSHCQNGGDVCLAGNRDGVCCPEDSCDIDDGVRKAPISSDDLDRLLIALGLEPRTYRRSDGHLLVGAILSALAKKHAADASPSRECEQVGEDSRRVDELSMLIRQLVHALRKAAPDNDLAGRAGDYLKRAGLQGSPLRVEAPDTSPSREYGEQQECPHDQDDGACGWCYDDKVASARTPTAPTQELAQNVLTESWVRRAQAAVNAVVGEKDEETLLKLAGRMEQLLREALEAAPAQREPVACGVCEPGECAAVDCGYPCITDQQRSNWAFLVNCWDEAQHGSPARAGAGAMAIDALRRLLAALQAAPVVAHPQAAEPKGLTEHLYILSANEEAMESAIEAFEGSSEGEGLKSVLYAQKQLCALLAKGE